MSKFTSASTRTTTAPSANARSSFDHRKYVAYDAPALPDRTWPDQVITQAPIWCSVDLRDGNQALVDPMTVPQKVTMFELLVDMGFKEIEIGFPSASQTEFDFCRKLIEENRIPDDVTIQVLVQARELLIARTYEALKGAKKAIVHVYNSTSRVQREQVFQQDMKEIRNLARQGARWVKDYAMQYPETHWRFQYSPESFTGTELEYAISVCNAVLDVWQPTADAKAIINLPATVEMSTPNVFADQVERVHRALACRDAVVLSVHTHNDRGTGIAASELAVMAGADRVEGTLLGNGERTGNMDIFTMAMNLYSRGVDPELYLADVDRIEQVYTECNNLPVHPRHPYIGELVYTAFSGSHQDAIKKCLDARQTNDPWEVAYLPIDPADLGRNYEAVIRVNSQSGKGGVAYLLEQQTGFRLPRALQVAFSQVVQQESERSSKEIRTDWIEASFNAQYCRKAPLAIESYRLNAARDGKDQLAVEVRFNGQVQTWVGKGQGPLAAWVNAVNSHCGLNLEVDDYAEHSLGHDKDANAVAFVALTMGKDTFWGCATGSDIVRTALDALAAGCNAALSQAGNEGSLSELA
ncbi:2-isopropylmalate synthase [Nitrincola sp. MINF-07-Sa-05]|uniref:2-isopropylmalate synthase n=1 Tax=Nitrincola salilacus TaxID=3400273 RepID=UPI003918220C